MSGPTEHLSNTDSHAGRLIGAARGKIGGTLHQFRGDGLRARAMRGSSWTLFGFGTSQVLRLGSNLILTRLLFPEAFGLMALASVFMTGLQMFSDIGIRPSIIQNKRGEDIEFLNTAWTMQVIRGFVLTAIACALAYPVSILYEVPTLFPLLCVIGSTAAIRGFQTTGYATSNRKIQLGKLIMVELTTTLAGIVAMIVWAWIHPTVWALAGGGVFASILSVLLGHKVLNTHRHRLQWDRSSAQELIKFGKWIVISSIITFVAQSGDRVLLPKVLAITDLAYYSLALVLAQMPAQIFKQLASKVLFPAFSEAIAHGQHGKLNKIIRHFALASSPAYLYPLALIFFAESLIGFLYDPRYAPTAGALTLLAVGSWFAMLRSCQSGLLLAAGYSRGSMLINLTTVLSGLPLAVWLGTRAGLEGFCVGIVASEAIAYLIQRRLVSTTVEGLGRAVDYAVLCILLAVITLKTGLVILGIAG